MLHAHIQPVNNKNTTSCLHDSVLPTKWSVAQINIVLHIHAISFADAINTRTSDNNGAFNRCVGQSRIASLLRCGPLLAPTYEHFKNKRYTSARKHNKHTQMAVSSIRYGCGYLGMWMCVCEWFVMALITMHTREHWTCDILSMEGVRISYRAKSGYPQPNEHKMDNNIHTFPDIFHEIIICLTRMHVPYDY